MEFNLFPILVSENNNSNKKIVKYLKKLNKMYLDETYKNNKVAFYYEDSLGNIISYNKDICFYAASTIKVLVCIILFEKAENNEINLDEELLITMNELKQGTGIIKQQKQDTAYKILELIKLTITESDNTSYLKLVSLVGKENIKSYGLSLGATHTMEGKDSDSFGLINCTDMVIYWKKIHEYIESNKKYSSLLKDYLLNPSFKIIKDKSINHYKFMRKYGSYDIAYHEAGYIETNNPFIIIILTQLNKTKYKNKFINKTAKNLLKINNKIT